MRSYSALRHETLNLFFSNKHLNNHNPHRNMAEAKSKTDKDLLSLKATVQTVLDLIPRLTSAVKLGSPTGGKHDDNVRALDLAHDAASLLKAHSTKLSLLIINTPFTPTAIVSVLREVSSGPLPAIATAVEYCDARHYTRIVRAELQWRSEKVLMEFMNFVRQIPLDGKVLSTEKKNGNTAGMGNGSLASTGLVWEACDALADLKKIGIPGMVVRKAEQYRDTLRDALEELQEWGEETSDDDGEEDDSVDENDVREEGGIDAAQDAIDSMFHGQRHIPTNDTQKIRERFDTAVPQLKLTILLYQAIIKRRFKILPSIASLNASTSANQVGSSITEQVDEALIQLKDIPDTVDEMANAFYELDGDEIDKRLQQCCIQGSAAAKLLLKNWDGKEDEFSKWAEKFIAAMKR